jgi:hypothetical protein
MILVDGGHNRHSRPPCRPAMTSRRGHVGPGHQPGLAYINPAFDSGASTTLSALRFILTIILYFSGLRHSRRALLLLLFLRPWSWPPPRPPPSARRTTTSRRRRRQPAVTAETRRRCQRSSSRGGRGSTAEAARGSGGGATRC